MSYQEENGAVILTMSREDYDLLLLELGKRCDPFEMPSRKWLRVMNRLNQGNPNYTAYQVKP